MDIWVVSTSCPLGTVLLRTFVYQFLCGRLFSFLLDVYLAVELLGHVVTLCLTFWEAARLFPKKLPYFSLPVAV